MTLTLERQDLMPGRQLIGAEWREASDARRLDVTDPATDAVFASVPDGTAADARAAVDAAHAAFPAWRAVPAKQRAQIIKRWNDLVMAHQEDLGRLISREQGKPLAEGRGEVAYAASYIEWFAEEATRANGDVIPAPVPGRRMFALKEPVGVVAAITPWNFPAAMIARKIAPALAAGCTVVCKPAEDTPLTSLALVKLAQEAGVPAGVLNIVTASRERTPEVVDVWLDDARVRKISFTGSTPVGKHLARALGRHAEEAVARARRQRALHRVRRRRPRCRGRRPDGRQVPQRRPDLRLPEPRVRAGAACTTPSPTSWPGASARSRWARPASPARRSAR